MMENRRQRLLTFASLYVVQGVGLAYFRNFQKPYLDNLGISSDAIGLLTFILQIPFILKIFIGIISDRINLFNAGYRKPYIIMGLVLAAISFGSAYFIIPTDSFFLFALLIIIGSFSVTVFDSTADGLAIDITPREEQGTVQGVMVGGRAAAFILLSLLFGVIVQRYGYQVVFPLIGLSMLVPLFWVRNIKPIQRVDPTRIFQWGAFKVLGKPKFLVFMLYAVIYSIGSFGVDGLVTYYLSDQLQAVETSIGLYGALRGGGALLGAIGGGLIIDKLSRKNNAVAATVLISLGAILFGVTTAIPLVVSLGLVWGIVWAFQETMFFALAMDIADRRIAASMFAIMMGVSNLGSAVADGVATALSDNLGFRMVFIGLSLINLVTIPILYMLFHKAPELLRVNSSQVDH
jgi:MFS family permease